MNNSREELKQFMENRGISQNQVAKSLPFSAATLSQWLNDSYPVKDQKKIKIIEDAVKDFLLKERARIEDKNGSTIIPFIQHINYRIFSEIASLCHHYCEIGVICGQPGVGKTMSAKKYAELHPDVIYIEADQSFTTKVIFKTIYKYLGGTESLGIHDLIEWVKERLKDSKRLIIIDQAEYLPNRALDLIRTLHDKCLNDNNKGTLGILLTGLPILKENLKGLNNQFAQLYQRISWYRRIGSMRDQQGFIMDITDEDVESFVLSVFPSCNGEIKIFRELSKSNPRVLCRLIDRSKKLCDMNKVKLSADIIREASKTIIM